MGDDLRSYRDRLDVIDERIAELFGERFEICRAIAAYKSEHRIPMMQPDRVEEVRGHYVDRGARVGLPSAFTVRLFELLIEATCQMEDELIEADMRVKGS